MDGFHDTRHCAHCIQVYIRDLESSSGTFLNSRRLCGPNQRSQPFQLHDNDIIQLGVDYQGGTQGNSEELISVFSDNDTILQSYRNLPCCKDAIGIEQEPTTNRKYEQIQVRYNRGQSGIHAKDSACEACKPTIRYAI